MANGRVSTNSTKFFDWGREFVDDWWVDGRVSVDSVKCFNQAMRIHRRSMPNGQVSAYLEKCSVPPREKTDGRWRKEGDDVSCHVNIHVSCHINQNIMLESMCHATSMSMCHATSTNRDGRWLMIGCWLNGRSVSSANRDGWRPMVNYRMLIEWEKCFVSQRGLSMDDGRVGLLVVCFKWLLREMTEGWWPTVGCQGDSRSILVW
jgi:hypothetical protein